MKNVYIIYPSWEERSFLGFQRYLVNNSLDIVYIIEKENSINSEVTLSSINKIKQLCLDNDIEIIPVSINNNEKEIYEQVIYLVETIDRQNKIFLDITTMSRNIIWTLLFSIKQCYSNLEVLYNLPECYCDDWISKEPSTPSLLFKHSGIIDLDLKNCLIIITGFDTDRTKQLVKFYDPQKIVLLVQSSNQFDNNKRNNSKDHLNVCLELGYNPNNIEINSIDAYGIDLGRKVIEFVTLKYKEEYNLIFASLGPKLSAISLYEVFLNNSEIALSYVPSKKYNPNYCRGLGEQVISKIVF